MFKEGHRSRLIYRVLFSLIVLAMILRIPILSVRSFDQDEFEHLHAARCVCHGMVPYRDFFEHHTPLFYFLLAPLYRFSGDSISTLFISRGIMFIFICASLFLTYFIARSLYGSGIALYAVFFLSYFELFVQKSIEVRPDAPAAVFLLLTIILLIMGMGNGHGRDKRRLYFIASGFALGISILFTQKVLFGAAGLFLALVWMALDKRIELPVKEKAVSFLWFGVGMAVPIGMMCLYFSREGAMNDFIYRTWTMNISWKTKFSPCGLIGEILMQNPFFCTWGLMGLAVSTARLKERKTAAGGTFLVSIITYVFILGLFLIRVPYRQYYMLFIPLLAIYCGLFFDTLIECFSRQRIRMLWDKGRYIYIFIMAAGFIIPLTLSVYHLLNKKMFLPGLVNIENMGLLLRLCLLCISISLMLKNKRSIAALALLSAAAVSPLVWMSSQFLEIDFSASGKKPAVQFRKEGRSQLDAIRFILRNSTPNDRVFDGWSGYGVFRDHAYYYYFLHAEIRRMLTKKESSEDIVDALRKNRAKLVIYDGAVKQLPEKVTDYILKNYIPTGVDNIYMLKGEMSESDRDR